MPKAPRNLLDLAGELSERPCPLSATDLELVRCLGEGLTPTEIAEHWKTTKSSIYSRAAGVRYLLGVVDRAQAVLVCIYCGWLQIDDVLASANEGAK